MVQTCRTSLVLLFVLAAAPSALGRFQPSFHLDSCVWDATHIVIVTQADKTDIAGEVVDSLKGDLKKGDRITIPDLAEFAVESEQAIKKAWLPLLKECPNPPIHLHRCLMIL